jgi:hypothetical protein
MPQALNQYAVPRVTINVGGKFSGGLVTGGTDIDDVLDYSYTSDILTLTDTAAIDVVNANGKYTGVIAKGSRLFVSMADPNVNGGAKVLRLSGLVVNPRMMSRGGEKIQIQAADQGWYLERCDAPLYMNLQASRDFAGFLKRLLQGPKGEDFGWGFQDTFGSLNVISDNTIYRALNQGRAGIDRSAVVKAQKGTKETQFIPPLQVEAGTKIGQLLIDYAKRSKRLVNVSNDGTLMIFQPNYQQDISFRVDYHADAQRNKQNGVLDVTIDDSVDGIATGEYTVCVTQVTSVAPTNENPNVDKIRGRFRKPTAAPHYMRQTFGDSDQIGSTAASTRAQWAQQRGEFDAWSMQVELYGHSQGGVFFAPDTMVAVNDSVHRVVGNYYCSACRYVRDRGGTKTTVTLRKPNLLAA